MTEPNQRTISPGRPVVELRRYTTQPGQRDVLIELFDEAFVETQEAVGMTIIGQFRDLDDPDRFVWLRGFADMASRRDALSAFYGGPVWRRHRAAANATMVDSDDVFLLRPACCGGTAEPPQAIRPPQGSVAVPSTVVVAQVYRLRVDDDAAFVRFLDREVIPVLSACGAAPIACWRTEPAENNFPALPVRTGERVVVTLARFGDVDEYAAYAARLARSHAWTRRVRPMLPEWVESTERLMLSPTARSLLR